MKKNTINKYLEKHANYPAWIDIPAVVDLSIVVVIPCYNEPDVKSTLDSLAKCNYQGFQVEVLVIVNQSEDEAEEIYDANQETLQVLSSWSHPNTKFKLHIIFSKDIPVKKAGVGYARKTGMDEAVRRLEQGNKRDKIILCLDADTLVQTNYLQTVYDYFFAHPKCPAASIDYAHPLNNSDDAVNQAILEYELHLRYYVLAQRWSGLGYAQQTVGSAMAVRTEDYQRQGGMNTRKAGEDFYFIHKFTHYSDFGNITNTTVIPSARISDRVPFGTGRAMMSRLANQEPLNTYAPQSFAAIKKLIIQLPHVYKGGHALKNSEAMSVFLRNYQFHVKLDEIKANTSDYTSFQKRFFRWFDAFLCMKFLHFARDKYYPNIPVKDAANWLNQTYLGANKNVDELELLTKFRQQTNT